MTDLWYADARRVPFTGCGEMKGGPARVVHHTTEGGTIDGAVSTYRQTGNYPTFTVDYAKDEVVQHVPANVGATAVRNASGGVETNREGSVCIQIEWIGQAAHPFNRDASGHLIPAGPNVRGLFDFCRAHGVPNVWPMGAPKAYPDSYGASNGDRSAQIWTSTAGHYGHSQVPENVHGDPGAIEPSFVAQTAHPTPPPAVKTAGTYQEETPVVIAKGSKPEVYVTDLITKRHVADQRELKALHDLGLEDVTLADDLLARIPTVK